MKKRIVIGDLHGRYKYLEDAYRYEDPDEVILLGDYFDSWNIWPEEQEKSYLKTLELRKEHLAKGRGHWIMLLGNHDTHYLPGWPGRSSGWNQDTEFRVQSKLSWGLDDGTLRMAWIDSDIKTIYSHAGLSQVWFERWLEGSLGNIESVSFDAFRFVGADFYGDDPRNSPLWIRPASLMSGPYQDGSGHLWDQVFGHTESMSPTTWNKTGKDEEISEFWCIDCLPKAYLRETIDGIQVTRDLIDSFSHEVILDSEEEDLVLSIFPRDNNV